MPQKRRTFCHKHQRPRVWVASEKKSRCSVCCNEKAKAWRERNPGHEIGLRGQEYDKMASDQEGRCAICRELVKGRLLVDHCHKTTKVRGLLCKQCNWGIGHFKDDPERLRSAAAYLERTRE